MAQAYRAPLAPPPALGEIGHQLFGGADSMYGDGLLAALRSAGLTIGFRERMAVSGLVTALIAQSEGPVYLADLGPSLAPLLARNVEERERFFSIFNALKARWPTSNAVPPPATNSHRGAPELPLETSSFFERVPLTRIALISAFFALAVFVWFALQPRETILNVTRNSIEVESVAELQRAASKFFFAPTLQELSVELRPSLAPQDSLALLISRFNALTGMSVSTPVAIASSDGPRGEAVENAVRLANAIILIRSPSASPNLKLIRDTLDSQISDAAAGRADLLRTSSAPLLSEALARSFPPLQSLPLEKSAALQQIRDAFGLPHTSDALIERALAVSTEPNLQRTWSDAVWANLKSPEEPGVAWWLQWWGFPLAIGIAGLLVGLGLYWLLKEFARKQAYLRQRKPEFPPLHMDLVADAWNGAKDDALLFALSAQRLLQRTPRQSDRLDIFRTVNATLKEGGQLICPVFESTRATPEYVALVEKQSVGDHEYERARAMLAKLSPLVHIETYTFQFEPSMLERVDGGSIEPIEAIHARHPDHRLLVIGTGHGFLDIRTRKPLSGPEKLMLWPKRAMLTPVPVSEWTSDDLALSDNLKMPIGRATPEGLATLPKLLALETTNDSLRWSYVGDNAAMPLPEALRWRGTEFLVEWPMGKHSNRARSHMIQALKSYLDPAGFDWLCSLAVYPAVQWDLTGYLGQELALSPGGADSEERIYSARRLAAISQLPWLRHGRMPNWVRRALLEAMSKVRQTEVRKAIDKVLNAARPTLDADTRSRIHFRIGQEPIKDPLKNGVLEDEVLLDFLARGEPEDFHWKKSEPLPSRSASFSFDAIWREIQSRFSDLRSRLGAFKAQLRDRPARTSAADASRDHLNEGESKRAPVAIVTVHSTNDGAASPAGEKWFQSGSEFTSRLLRALRAKGIEAEIVPFIWGGGNSARQRERAADKLSDSIKRLNIQFEEVHLLAHGQGGNVANEAADTLKWGRRNAPSKERIDSVTTVGTPFFKRSSSAGETLGGLLFMFFTALSALSVLILGAALVWLIVSGELHTPNTDVTGGTTDPGEIAATNTFMFLVIGLAVFGLLLMMRLAFSGTRRLLRPTSRKGATTAVTAIWHPNDEAIAFLQKVDQLPVAPLAKGALFDGSRTNAIIWGVQFVLLLGALALYQLVVQAMGLEGGGWWLPYGAAAAADSNFLGQPAAIVMLFMLFMMPILFFTVYLAYRFFFGLYPEWFLRESINRAFADTLRSMQFGQDGDVLLTDVSSASHTYPTEEIVLDGDLCDRMAQNATNVARSLIEKHRWRLLEVGVDPYAALKEMATDPMTCDSLIHTTYFDQPEIVERIADLIIAKSSVFRNSQQEGSLG